MATLVHKAGEVPVTSLMETDFDNFFSRWNKLTNAMMRRPFSLFPTGENFKELFGNLEFLDAVPIEIRETDKEFLIEAKVPGFKENELDIRVEANRVFVTGKLTEKKEEKQKGKTIYSESRSNEIFRTIELPSNIDPEKVTASLVQGVLTITLTKVAPAKAVKVMAKAA